MAKVYFCKFIDKQTNKIFYKFGHTQRMDVLERFDPKYDIRYEQFNIKAICSIRGDLKWCIQIEEIFKKLFPKNIWLEEYLGNNRQWDNFSGITEIVQLSSDEYRRILDAFYKLKEIQESSNEF